MSFTERGKRRKRESFIEKEEKKKKLICFCFEGSKDRRHLICNRCFYKIETDEHRDDLFEYVSYNRFKDLELIAEGGFSKIYKATWMDEMNKCVVLKELDNSKNINYNELNELKIFHNYITLKHYARRRPFWDKSHDTDLIIEICDGLRPPIITNAPEGYIELMQKCWHSDPKKRPKAVEIYEKVGNIWSNESLNGNSTKIIRSPDIGPIATNHSGAYYKSRPLSAMIKSVESTRNLRSQSIFSETVKRKFDDNLINDKIIKKTKLSPNEGNDYLTREFGFDIDNASSNKSNKNDYTSKEINFDI
ncbi:unnamed protein product [Rhizophagus irregularis]|nr:unnamed protein product [Rhizophagus irregularis]